MRAEMGLVGRWRRVRVSCAFMLVETHLEVPERGAEFGDPAVTNGPQPLLGEAALLAHTSEGGGHGRVFDGGLECVPVRGRGCRERRRSGNR